MTRLILLAAGGLLLATANTPPSTEGELSSVVAAGPPAHSPAPAPAPAAASGASHASVATAHRVRMAMRAGERG